ncbi:MAG: NAD-dependent epimerase/dehydratase family protein [Candidatus Thorarchaeota archaeon]
MNRVLVTGGAGFIGSHLVDALVGDFEVTVLDDLSTGSEEYIRPHMSTDGFRFIRGTVVSEEDVKRALDGVDTVFHFAAQPDVRLSVERPLWDFKVNVHGSIMVLDRAREAGIKRFIFASSGGTVYGDRPETPTRENCVLRPVSNYGASKAAVEMYLSSYSELYGMHAVSLRLANVVGPRSTHGVIHDFYMRLREDASRLLVLGTGTQEKSYLYVSDAVNATLILANKMPKGFTPINVSSGERLRVSEIADMVVRELAPGAKIEYTGSERGWPGDVVTTDIDVSLLKSLGWHPEVSIREGIYRYLQWLKERYGPIHTSS